MEPSVSFDQDQLTAAKEALRAEGLRLGFDEVGFCVPDLAEGLEFYRKWLAAGFGAEMDFLARHAELKASLESLLEGAKSVAAVRASYCQPHWDGDPHAKVARYALGKDYHKVLRKKLSVLGDTAARLLPGVHTRACTDSAPALERLIAHQAGLGWFGKNTLLIDSKYGSWFFIGLLVFDAVLPPDRPAEGGCGTCTACIDACPTGAIVPFEGRWAVDSRKCISFLTIEKRGPMSEAEQKSLSGWMFGCDVCQEVCPFNQPRESQPQRAALTQIEAFKDRLQPVSGDDIAAMSPEEWDAWSLGRPIRRAGLDGLKRNLGRT